jgi:hypothetical protein|tara:strand:+ start:1563 stop:1889 length:327 start_codon:yes stop_codon:yes gene_type:complete
LTLAEGEYIKDMRHMEYMKHQAEKEKQAMAQPNNIRNNEMVNHPAHYNKAGIETIDALAAMLGDGFQPYLQGNIMKYLWRYKYKNGKEDLKKAQWYLNKLIEVYDDKS